MTKKISSDLRFHWVDAQSADDESAIEKLILELKSRYENTRREEIELPEKDRLQLEMRFRRAEMSRSPLRKFMEAIAKEAGIKDYREAVQIVPLKTWERAVDKNASGRKLNDLIRGCIYIDSPDEIERIFNLIKRANREGYIRTVSDTVRVIPGTIDNYFEKPRLKSSYSGSLNFDVEGSLGKNRSENSEVQVRPKSQLYSNAYDWSHRLYDLIRIIDEFPGQFVPSILKNIRDHLKLSNAAMYDEQAIRTGFDRLRKVPMHLITEDEHIKCIGTLDAIRDKIFAIHKENDGWSGKSMEALSFAKTSVTQLFIAAQRKRSQEIAASRSIA